MSNFGGMQDRKKETREKDKVRRKKLAGYFFDLSKLSFAGLVIGGITPLFSSEKELNLYVISAGMVSTYLLAWIANRILK